MISYIYNLHINILKHHTANMMPSSIQEEPSTVISKHPLANVVFNRQSNQYCLMATTDINAGDIVSRFEAGEVLSTPNYLTVQTGTNRHITLMPAYLQYINHSCNPNVFFNTTSMELVALKNIGANEELVFFYPSTEYDMDRPFLCFCGSDTCLNDIKGARYIPYDVLQRYRLSDFILQQLEPVFAITQP